MYRKAVMLNMMSHLNRTPCLYPLQVHCRQTQYNCMLFQICFVASFCDKYSYKNQTVAQTNYIVYTYPQPHPWIENFLTFTTIIIDA